MFREIRRSRRQPGLRSRRADHSSLKSKRVSAITRWMSTPLERGFVSDPVQPFESSCGSRRAEPASDLAIPAGETPSLPFSPPNGRSTPYDRQDFVTLACRAQRTVQVRLRAPSGSRLFLRPACASPDGPTRLRLARGEKCRLVKALKALIRDRHGLLIATWRDMQARFFPLVGGTFKQETSGWVSTRLDKQDVSGQALSCRAGWKYCRFSSSYGS